MKLVYLASPLRGNYNENIRNAVEYSRIASERNVIPIAPHTVFTQYLNDTIPEQREKGLKLGLELIPKCDELWVMGKIISQGMTGEIAFAKKNRIPIFTVENPMELDSYPISTDRNSLLGAHSCMESSKSRDYENQILVLRHDVLKPEYRTPLCQLWRAMSGFGCSPTASGRTVYATSLYDGEETHFRRQDFVGIVKPEVLEQVQVAYAKGPDNVVFLAEYQADEEMGR